MQHFAAPSLSAASRWQIIVLLMIYAALGHFNRLGISVAGSEVFIPELGITETRMGWVYTAFLIVYTLAMLPGGWLIDRLGAAWALTLLGLTMGTFVALTGTLHWLSVTPLGLWIGLLIIRSLAGPCNAPLHPGAARVVSDVIPRSGQASANGLITAGALIGVAFCYPVFGWLIERLGWPWAFIVSGMALFAFGILWRLLAVPQLPGPPPASAPASPDPADLLHPPPAGWALLHQKSLWLLTLSYAAFGYFQYLFFYWLGHYFKDELHLPNVESRNFTMYIMLAMGAGMALGGLSTDLFCRLFGTIAGRRTIVMTGMCLAALFALRAVQVTQPTEVVLWLALSMGALGLCEGVFWTTATDIGGRARGFAGAFMNTGGNVGGFISPVLTPMMADRLGWPLAIAVACAISGIGGLVWFGINPKSPE